MAPRKKRLRSGREIGVAEVTLADRAGSAVIPAEQVIPAAATSAAPVDRADSALVGRAAPVGRAVSAVAAGTKEVEPSSASTPVSLATNWSNDSTSELPVDSLDWR